MAAKGSDVSGRDREAIESVTRVKTLEQVNDWIRETQRQIARDSAAARRRATTASTVAVIVALGVLGVSLWMLQRVRAESAAAERSVRLVAEDVTTRLAEARRQVESASAEFEQMRHVINSARELDAEVHRLRDTLSKQNLDSLAKRIAQAEASVQRVETLQQRIPGETVDQYLRNLEAYKNEMDTTLTRLRALEAEWRKRLQQLSDPPGKE
jgi:hypothetical protein